MANPKEWGQAHVNNDIGFGQGATNNSIGWGSIYYLSWSGDTNLVGISQEAIDFKDFVENDGGTVEALFCVSQGIK